MKRLLRLLIMVVLGVVAFFVAKAFNVPESFLVAPFALGVVFVVCWDLLRFEAIDKGFFKFLKFVVMIAAFVYLLLDIRKDSLLLLNKTLVDINSNFSTFYILTICGAISMLVFTFWISFALVEGTGNRNLCYFAPIGGLLGGLLVGFIVSVTLVIGVGFAKLVAQLPLIVVVIVLWNHIHETGLLFADLPRDAKFQGFGSLTKGKGPQKTGKPVDDAMKQVAWSESKYLDLYYNNKINIDVVVYIYSYEVDFEIIGTVYINNHQMNANQVNDVNKQIDTMLKNKQNKVLNRAKKELEKVYTKHPNLNAGHTINVKIKDITIK